MLFDTHTHLNDPDLYAEVDAVLERARAAGVRRFVVPGYDRPACERALELAHRFEDVYAAVGFHPSDAGSVADRDFAALEEWAQAQKVVAIGEIGLDYHDGAPPRDVQKAVLSAQVALAKKLGLPVVVHDREAHADILALLRAEGAGAAGGVMHCFSGGPEMMKECVGLGFYIGLGGPVTFRNAKAAQLAARDAPLDRLLIETDAPWLAPVPHRGKRNEPAFVAFVAAAVAQLRGMAEADLAAAACANACRLFKVE